MRAVISIGSNLDDPVAQVQLALTRLARDFTLIAHSGLYQTTPVGGPEQGDFINAVAIVETSLTPKELLARLHEVEADFGRVRTVHWGPRTLDLDVISVDGQTSDDPELTLPHPRAHERAFVLLPWLEIDPEAFLNGMGKVREIVISREQEVRRI